MIRSVVNIGIYESVWHNFYSWVPVPIHDCVWTLTFVKLLLDFVSQFIENRFIVWVFFNGALSIVIALIVTINKRLATLSVLLLLHQERIFWLFLLRVIGVFFGILLFLLTLLVLLDWNYSFVGENTWTAAFESFNVLRQVLQRFFVIISEGSIHVWQISWSFDVWCSIVERISSSLVQVVEKRRSWLQHFVCFLHEVWLSESSPGIEWVCPLALIYFSFFLVAFLQSVLVPNGAVDDPSYQWKCQEWHLVEKGTHWRNHIWILWKSCIVACILIS